MKKIVSEFLRRGLVASGIGPLVLAVLYLALRQRAGMQTLTVDQVCRGIFSLWALAFVAGGMNTVYQIERLPLMVAILIHGGVLYVSYLVTYLINDWLELGSGPVLVFTVIFVLGYLAVWAVIYATIRKRTKQVNELLKRKHQEEAGPDRRNGE